MWKKVEEGNFPKEGFYFGLANNCIPCIALSDGETLFDLVIAVGGNEHTKLTHYMEIPKLEIE